MERYDAATYGDRLAGLELDSRSGGWDGKPLTAASSESEPA